MMTSIATVDRQESAETVESKSPGNPGLFFCSFDSHSRVQTCTDSHFAYTNTRSSEFNDYHVSKAPNWISAGPGDGFLAGSGWNRKTYS